MLKSINKFFRIESVGYPYVQSFSKNYAFDGESHDFVEIVYVQSGRIEVSENEKIYLLDSGNMIFHAPMEFHRIKSADGTTPCVINLSITVSGEVPEAFYDGVFELDVNECEEYMSIFNAAEAFMRRQTAEGEFSGQMVASRLEAFIIGICARNNKSNNISSDAGAVMFKKLVRSMTEHIYEGVSLSKLAKEHYISVSYVKSLFNRYAGTSPGDYFSRLRANEAARLINSGVQFTRIAEMMNFSSPNYFSLFFKKHMGKTPSEYKKDLID